MKTSPKKILLNTILLLFISTAAWSATSPVIFYSDLTSGPNTGGQNNAGVFVTVWGNNFGSTQGSSTVTVGGGAVANIQSWSNTEICFQLGSSAATGNIVVTTSNGASNGIPFTVRSGNIYFVQPGASTNGTGTYASPFNHLWYAYNIITAGDTVYVMSGTITDEANGYTNYHSILCTTKSGTQASPIAWVAYPNATAIIKADYASMTWTDGSSGGGDTAQYIFNYNGGNWNTFSKFTLQLTPGYTAIQTGNATGWRIVGNNLTASSYSYAIIELGSNSLANNTEILGNEIHDSGAGQSENNEDHSIYWDGGGANVEIAWNYLHGNKNSGWEISCFHQGQRNGSIHDNLIIAGGAGSVKGILLGDVDGGETESTEEASTYNVYNNVLVNVGQYEYGGVIQAVSGTAYIYNNTIYGSGTETMGVLQFPTGGIGPGGGHPVWYVANNIIVANNSGLYLSDENGNAPSWTNFALLTNNNYYGEGNGPSQDAKPLNVNPQLVAPSTAIGGNFQLQSTSPDINAGYNTISMVTKDLSGLLRSSTPSIGAYEYTGSVASSSPVVAITSPTSGSAVIAGSNITFTATASETNGSIAKVSFYYNGTNLIGTSTTAPYTYTATGVTAGSYTFVAIATDANGVTTTSSPVTVTVNTQSVTPSSPVVSITSPASGSTYTAGANVTITSTASETNGTISNISLYNGSGILLGSSNSSPYNYVYNGILAGGYSFYAVATDANGVSTTSSDIIITVTASSVPVVTLTNPVNGNSYTAGSNVTFTATASESNGSIAKVSFYYNGTNLIGTSTTAPYAFTATGVTAGAYNFYAVATDAKGVSTTSGSVAVTVTGSSVAPSITTQPANVTVTAPATATFTVAATGTPAPTYQWMQEVSGASTYTAISGATSASYTTAATTSANSGTKFECVVTNTAGSVTSNSATLTVTASSVPVVALTNPVNGNSYTAGSNVTFTATASESNGSIAKVSFYYNGTNLIGTSTTAPYAFTATGVTAGAYNFYAVATDAKGVSTTSGSVAVTVTGSSVAPSITTQPANVTVTAPATATFTVAATGTPAPTYQWMQEVSGASTYTAISGATSASYTTAATTSANSGTKFECLVTNTAGSATSGSATLTVNPKPSLPTVSLASNNTSFTAPASIILTATASEINGTISKVAFYNGSALLGTVTSSPFTYTWSNVAIGSYSLTAIVTDAHGISVTSSPVLVVVRRHR